MRTRLTTINPEIDKIKTIIFYNEDWKKKIIKRYVKFVDEIVNNNADIQQLAAKFDYREEDMASILKRIRAHFENVFLN